jgi:hypothetical protein
MWTPRLVRFLLALMFNDFGNRKPAGAPNVRLHPMRVKGRCAENAHRLLGRH